MLPLAEVSVGIMEVVPWARWAEVALRYASASSSM